MTEMVTTETGRNGVDTEELFATVDAVKAQPAAASFQFRASNRWIGGTHSRTTISGFYGVGQEQTHERATTHDADHPAVLVGGDRGDAHRVPAARAGRLPDRWCRKRRRGPKHPANRSRVVVEGDIDLPGVLGLSDDARNGYQQVRVGFRVKGDADDETLRGLVERSRRRSAVYDTITNGVPVDIVITTQLTPSAAFERRRHDRRRPKAEPGRVAGVPAGPQTRLQGMVLRAAQQSRRGLGWAACTLRINEARRGTLDTAVGIRRFDA